MLHRLTIVLFTGVALFALSADAQDKKDDKKAIQGTWNGKKGDQAVTLTIDATKFTLELAGKKIEGTYALDASKTPKHIDLTITSGSDAEAMKFEGKTSKGIYELESDQLKWLAPEPGLEDRPTAFPMDGEKVPKSIFFTFDREKK
jgi:uncharacterized protein (TIGR03067 family)